MIASVLRAFAIVASLVVIAGWGMFIIGEARDASAQTTTEIAGRTAARSADPSPDQERARELAHSEPREAIDDVNDVLLAPFAGVAEEAGSRWVRRSVPAILALLVYGFGIGFLARYAAVR